MININLKDKIHYVGVNDRNTHRFEGMWPLPYGVSYNSYLIEDESVVLVDTVDITYLDVFLDKIKSVLGERPVDYLVINHMEPDHSGSIRALKQVYPDMVIVGNKQTFGMVEGFYGITDKWQVVKEGDTLETGHHVLKFYMTPMVHWPETMMTYEETEGVLFSGDAFGCFGALNGGCIDVTMNTDLYWDEMVRYYSNIVGKYGTPVQKALGKFADIPIHMICSTHGPVWTGENIARVVGIYDRLSRYEAEEGVVVAYASMYGNTEQLAERIAAELNAAGVKNVILHKLNKTDASFVLRDVFKYKGLIVGGPTYNGQLYPEVESFLSKLSLRELKNRYVGYFGSFTWAGAAVKRTAAWAETMSQLEVVSPAVELKQGRLNEIDTKAHELAVAMAEKIKE